MEADVEKMEAQLKQWGLRIEHLAAKTRKTGVPTRFDAIMDIDELKALHAIAQAKLDAFQATKDTERARRKAELKWAWNELGAAFKNPKPSP